MRKMLTEFLDNNFGLVAKNVVRILFTCKQRSNIFNIEFVSYGGLFSPEKEFASLRW